MFFSFVRKSYLYAVKIYGVIIASLTIPSQAFGDDIAIIGGIDLTGSGPAYAALVSPSGSLTPLDLGANMASNGNILSVAINSDGNGIVGGQDLTGSQPAYACLQHVIGKKMTNESLRKRLGIKPSSYSLDYRIIRDAMQENLIKPQGDEVGAGKGAFYLPFWA